MNIYVCKNLNKIWKEKGEENIEIGWKKQMFNGEEGVGRVRGLILWSN